MKIKNLLYVLVASIMLASCGGSLGWSEKNHQVSKPFSLSGDNILVPSKWDTGYRKVPGHKDPTTGKWIPMQYKKDSVQPSEFKLVPREYVLVTPSKESVLKAANATGWEWQSKVGVFFLFITFILLVVYAKPYINRKKLTFEGTYTSGGQAVWMMRVAALTAIIGLLFITSNPVNKSGNNQKRITKEQYDNIIKTDPNLIKFFDSIQQNGKFVN
jgi:hypothetical protein